MQKVRQIALNFSENPFFCFWNVDILLCKRFEQFCTSRMSGPVIRKAFFKRHLQFLIKVPQMIAKLSKSKNLQFDWLGYTQSDEKKTNRYLVSSWGVSFWNGITLFKNCQTFFHQTSKRFHSVMATLESQKYVNAWTVWTEIILLVSWRLVEIWNWTTDQNIQFKHWYMHDILFIFWFCLSVLLISGGFCEKTHKIIVS